MLDKNDVIFAQNCADDLPGYRQRFVLEYQDMIKNTIAAVLKRRAGQSNFQWEIEDLTQDIFSLLFENGAIRLRSFRGQNGCSLGTWLRVVAARRTLNFLRRSCQYNQAVAETEMYASATRDLCPNADKIMNYKEAAASVQTAVSDFSGTNQLIFRLIFEDELSYEEVARVCRMTKNTLYSRVSRMKERLRQVIRKADVL